MALIDLLFVCFASLTLHYNRLSFYAFSVSAFLVEKRHEADVILTDFWKFEKE